MVMETSDMIHDITGSGGGKSGGGSGRAAQEDANTLRSNATAEIIELLGEGEVVGLVDGGRSIYLNDTPLIAEDGSANFNGVEWFFRPGLPDQEPLPNFIGASSEVQVSAKVTNKGGPLTRSITDPDIDAVRVTLATPGLTEQDPSTGDLHGSRVAYRIYVRANGGAWVTAVDSALEGKTTSTYQRAHRIDLPAGGAPWQVRVERVTADSTKANVQNELWWDSYSELTYGKFIYPDSAVLGLRIDAKQFGSSIPTRSYEVYGRKIRVPSNYTPATRTYSGLWDGTFKRAWSDNPAWIFLDLLLENRFGLGDFIAESQVDKWGLYQIARYADAVDSTGRFIGVPDGNGGRMPRFTYNGCMQTKEDAYKVLQQVASCFRGMTYWGSGQVFARADMPRDAVKLVTPANVVDGLFTYSSTAIKARHTVAHVTYNDPSDGFRPAIVVVEDRDGLLKYGYNVVEVAAPGATTREQAYRFGLWMLMSEQRETETVSYRCSFDHLDVMPGDVVLVQDPSYAGVRMGGRVAGIPDNSSVTLDAPVTLEAGQSYTVSITGTDGTIHDYPVLSAPGERTTLAFQGTYAVPTSVGAVWVLTASNLAPRPFQVMAVSESEPGIFAITALFNDPSKYAAVDNGTPPDDEVYTRPDTGAVVPKPTGLTATGTIYLANGNQKTSILVSWTPPSDPRISGFEAQSEAPGYSFAPIAVAGTSFTIDDAIDGAWNFRVRSIARDGRTSEWAMVSIDVGNETVAFVTGLEIDGQGNNTVFNGPNVDLVWRVNNVKLGRAWYSGDASGWVDPLFRDFEVRVYDSVTGDLLRVEWVQQTKFSYTFSMNRDDKGGPHRKLKFTVAYRQKNGHVDPEAKISVENPAPAAPVKPFVKVAVGSLIIGAEQPTDNDLVGMMVWQSFDKDFDPSTTEPAYRGPNNPITLPSDPNLTCYIRIAFFDQFGTDDLNYSPQIEAKAAFSVDATPPEVPTGLALTTGLDATGAPFIDASWKEAAAADTGVYELRLRRTDDTPGKYITTVARSEKTRIDPNADPKAPKPTPLPPTARFANLAPGVTYAVSVAAVDVVGNASQYCAEVTIVAARDTRPPGPPSTLAVSAAVRTLFLSWVNPTAPTTATSQYNNELSHIEVWGRRYATASDNDVSKAALLDRVAGNTFTHSGLGTNESWVYWVRAVNTSGNTGAFNSTVGIIGTTGFIARGDLEPGAPSAPTGLTLTSALAQSAEGVASITLTATWNAVTATDLSHYEIEYQRGSSPVISDTSGVPTKTWTVQPGAWKARVRAVDFALNKSDWSAWTNALSVGGDTTPPAAVTGLKALASFKNIYVSWTNPADSDLDQIEVRASTTTSMPGAATAFVSGSSYSHSGLGTGETWNYWARPIDLSGNAGPWSGPVSATTTKTGTFDIETGAIKAALIDAGQINTGHIATDGLDAKVIRIKGPTATKGLSEYFTGTYLDGTTIATGTVKAESLEIGSRTTILDLAFNANPERKASSPFTLSWARSLTAAGQAGSISYIDDDGSTKKQTIADGSTTATGYVAWVKGGSGLTAGLTADAAFADGRIVVGYWDATAGVWSPYLGRTIVTGDQIQTGAIRTTHMVADSIDGSVIKTDTLDAKVIKAGTGLNAGILIGPGGVTIGTVATNAATGAQDPVGRINTAGNGGSINVGGVSLGTVATNAATGAQDPVTRINTAGNGSAINVGAVTLGKLLEMASDPLSVMTAKQTYIAPGMIALTGSGANVVTLDKWRMGGDGTLINGGYIAANTVKANALTIGNRNVTMSVDIQLSYRDAAKTQPNGVVWTAGTIVYPRDDGSFAINNIAPGGKTVDSYATPVYVYWQKDATSLTTTTDAAAPLGDDRICIATWFGGSRLVVNYGGTVIDGDRIETGTIKAKQIAAGSITADRLEANVLSASNIKGGTITGATIYIGQTDTGIGRSFGISSDPAAPRLWVDNNAVRRIELGQLAGTTEFGLRIRDQSNKIIIDANGLGLSVAGTGNIVGNAVTVSATTSRADRVVDETANVIGATVVLDNPGVIFASFTGLLGFSAATTTEWQLSLIISNIGTGQVVPVMTTKTRAMDATVTLTGALAVPAGTFTAYVEYRPFGNPMELGQRTIFATGLKR